jgi:hypothetical protein
MDVLTGAYFTAPPGFNHAVDANLTVFNDELGMASGFRETANFEQLRELNKFTLNFEFQCLHGH